MTNSNRPEPLDSKQILASRGKRILSTLFDALITAAAVVLVTLASGQFEVAEPYLNNTIGLRVAVTITLTYCALHGYTLWRSSQTLGKKLFELQVVQHQPSRTANSITRQSTALPRRAHLPQLALRSSALLALVFIPDAGIWLQGLHLLDAAALFTSDRRTLHDYIARTSVIDLTLALTNTNSGSGANT